MRNPSTNCVDCQYHQKLRSNDRQVLRAEVYSSRCVSRVIGFSLTGRNWAVDSFEARRGFSWNGWWFWNLDTRPNDELRCPFERMLNQRWIFGIVFFLGGKRRDCACDHDQCTGCARRQYWP